MSTIASLPADRRAFEARLRQNAELRRQVGLWESQNRAIRAAYGAAASARAAIDLGGSSNENVPVWMASAMQSRRGADAPRGPRRSALEAAARGRRDRRAKAALDRARAAVRSPANSSWRSRRWPRASSPPARRAARRGRAAN